MIASITSLYAGLLALLVFIFAFRVSKTRQKEQVNLGDGGKSAMLRAMRIHGNAVEYVPLILLLMLILEVNGSAHWFLHAAGITLVVARLLHAWGLMQSEALTPGRFIGAGLSWLLLIVLGLDNLIHLV